MKHEHYIEKKQEEQIEEERKEKEKLAKQRREAIADKIDEIKKIPHKKLPANGNNSISFQISNKKVILYEDLSGFQIDNINYRLYNNLFINDGKVYFDVKFFFEKIGSKIYTGADGNIKIFE